MTHAACTQRLPWAQLVDYWAGELPPEELDTVDAHLMGCATCTAESARVAAITETVRGLLPPVITTELLEALRRRGVRVLENPMQPGERKDVVFPSDVDLLIHRLAELPVANATRVQFTLSDEDTGKIMARVEDAPFDAATRSVLVACQKHYASMPPNTVATVRVFEASGASTEQVYTILHHYEQPEKS